MKIAIISGAPYSLGWGRSQNLAREFALQGDEVHYLNAIEPLISREVLSHKERSNHSEEGVLLYYQKGLPVVRFPFLDPLNKMLIMPQLDTIVSKIGSIDLLLFYGVPQPWMVAYLIEAIPHKKVVYDCADDKAAMFSDLKGESSGIAVSEWEDLLLSQVDFSVGMSEAVCDILHKKSGGMVYRIENGVDLHLFHRREEDVVHSGPKRMVYTGAINDRLDMKRLRQCAESNSVEIDLYGNDSPVLEELEGIDNIHYKGYISYFSLPHILEQYDYGILPNRDIASIRNSSPLKVLQYLAVGLPVVSFPFPVWPELKKYVYCTEGDLSHVDENALLPSEESLGKYSWHKRVLQYKEILRFWGIS